MQEMNEKEGATISRDTKREVNTDTARLNSMNFPIRCSHFILHNIQRSGLPNPIWAVKKPAPLFSYFCTIFNPARQTRAVSPVKNSRIRGEWEYVREGRRII